MLLYSVIVCGLVWLNWIGVYEDCEGGIWLVSINVGLWYLLLCWW